MVAELNLGTITVDVVFKNIKNVHLSVYPPTGRVRITAPSRMSLDTLRVFAISKLGWIKQQQKKLQEQERETPREYLERESHYLWGKRYLLKMVESEAAPSVVLKHKHLILHVRPGASIEKRQIVLDEWYRKRLREAAEPIISKWESVMGVTVQKLFVQRMKTKWGSCNPRSGTIRLNADLAKKPSECLEYLVVHEMVHLIEPTHNSRFVSLIDLYMPSWKMHRGLLNQLPVSNQSWLY